MSLLVLPSGMPGRREEQGPRPWLHFRALREREGFITQDTRPLPHKATVTPPACAPRRRTAGSA